MMTISNTVQPTSCTMLQAVGAHEPRRPSSPRSSTIPGAPVSAPGTAARPSSRLPRTAPTAIATMAASGASGGSPGAGTSTRPALTSTSSEMARLPQSASWSLRPSRRGGGASSRVRGTSSVAVEGWWATGCGAAPITHSLRRYCPDQVRRVGRCRQRPSQPRRAPRLDWSEPSPSWRRREGARRRRRSVGPIPMDHDVTRLRLLATHQPMSSLDRVVAQFPFSSYDAISSTRMNPTGGWPWTAAGPYLAAGAAGLVVRFALVWTVRRRAGWPALVLVLLAVVLWSGASALALTRPDAAGMAFWSDLAYLGICLLAPAWILFVLRYTG